jgi:hypothetical protein
MYAPPNDFKNIIRAQPTNQLYIASSGSQPAFQPRIRREQSVQSTPFIHLNQGIESNIVQSRPFMDMAPINTRTDMRDMRQSQPYVAQVNTSTANNPYFQKFDITQDPRNVTRELQGAVYEDRSIRGSKQSKSLMERGLQHSWIDPDEIKNDIESRLKGTEVMRPSQSTLIRRDYGPSNSASNSIGAGSIGW